MSKPTKLSRQILCLNFAPLILLVLIVVATLLYIYFKRLSILQSIQTAVYTQQKLQLIGIVAALSSQIQQSFQYASIQVIAISRFNELSLFENVPVNQNFQIQYISALLLELGEENQIIEYLYMEDPLQFELWYSKNSIYYSQLSQDQQAAYQNFSYYGCITHAVQFANIQNKKQFLNFGCIFGNLQFEVLAKIRQEDGFTTENQASLNSEQEILMTPVSWIPSDYCAPGNVSTYDPRCDPGFYLNMNSSVPDGLTLTPLEVFNVLNPPILVQSLAYKQFQPVPGQPNSTQFYSMQYASIPINSLQDLLSKYLNSYNFLLFYSSTYQMVYYNAINGSDYQQIPTLQTAWLDQMSDDQQEIFFNAIPSNWNTVMYEQNVTVVPKDIVSLSNQFSDLPRVEVEYQINASTYFSIMQQIQVYAKSRTTSSIDNFYTISANFNKDDLLKNIKSLEGQISLKTSYQLLGGLIILICVLIAAYIFSLHFARSIEEPIDKLAKLLAVIDASYLQDINSNAILQCESMVDFKLHTNTPKNQNRIQSFNSLQDQNIEKNCKKILVDLVTNEEIRVLHESLTYVFQLIKYANQEFWSGSHDMALIKMAEAQGIYESLGNTTAQLSCTFNIGNIHFTRSRWDEAIAAYSDSLTLVNKQLEEAKSQENLPLPYNTPRTEHLQSRNRNKTIQSRRESNSEKSNIIVAQTVSLINKKMDQIEENQHKQSNQIQKQLAHKINSLLQKKFDRLYYILQANIYKYLINDLLTEHGSQVCQDLLKMLEQVCEEMGTVCQCLQFTIIYSKVIVAIYSQQLDKAENIIHNELQKITKTRESVAREFTLESPKNTVLECRSFTDEQNLLLKQSLTSPRGQLETIDFSKHCLSQYYHTPQDVVYQKIAYLEALLLHRQGKKYLAMKKLVIWLESSHQLDRYYFYLMEQLAKKIINCHDFCFNSGCTVNNTININLLFDSTQSPLLLSQSIEQIRNSLKKCMIDIKGKISIYLKCRANKKTLNIVQNQGIEWVMHHWQYMRQILMKESLKQIEQSNKTKTNNFYKKLMSLAKAGSQAKKLQKKKMIFIVVSAQEPDIKLDEFIQVLKKIGSKLIYYCIKENLNTSYLISKELSVVKSVTELHHELEGLFNSKAAEQPILIESL